MVQCLPTESLFRLLLQKSAQKRRGEFFKANFTELGDDVFANLAHALLGGVLAPLSCVEFDRKEDVFDESLKCFFSEIAKRVLVEWANQVVPHHLSLSAADLVFRPQRFRGLFAGSVVKLYDPSLLVGRFTK